MATHLLQLLLCLLLAAPAPLVARPEKRVGGSTGSASVFIPDPSLQPAGPHRENPSAGQDFAAGVCKYLYCHGNPVNGTDPSGHSTLTETITVNGAIRQLAAGTRTVTSVLNTLNRVDNILSMLELVMEIKSMLYSGKWRDVVSRAYKEAFSEAKEISLDLAVKSLMRQTDDIMLRVGLRWGVWLAANWNNVDRFVIYMPNPPGMPYGEIPIAKLTRMRKKLVLGFGIGDGTSEKRGRLTGLGIGMKGSTDRSHQVWRMDIHKLHDDSADIIDLPFHYHINNAPKY